MGITASDVFKQPGISNALIHNVHPAINVEFTLIAGYVLLPVIDSTSSLLVQLQIINKEAIKANDGKPLPLYQKALCGLTAGGLGALVGTPADLTLIRMQAGAHPPVVS